MADLSRAHAAGAPTSEDLISRLLDVGDDALVEVMRGVKDPCILAALSSANRRLCVLARSRLPLLLRVQAGRPREDQQARYITHPPTDDITNPAKLDRSFSGCAELHVAVMDPDSRDMARGVLTAARQLPALQRLRLHAFSSWPEQDLGGVKRLLRNLFRRLPALQQLQSLDLDVPYLPTLRPLAQVTCLQITTRHPIPINPPPNLPLLADWPNLVNLHLKGRQQVAPPAAPAAAGQQQAGPYFLPNSLVSLRLTDETGVRGLADSWVPHLGGCPQLQELEVCWGTIVEEGTRPTPLLQQLAQHSQQLRSLTTSYSHTTQQHLLLHQVDLWRPDADLAAVTGLQRLSASGLLHVGSHGEWQHLAQLPGLTSLTGASFYCAPNLQQAGVALALVHLEASCVLWFDGYEVGRLLLACPVLLRADLNLGGKRRILEGQPLVGHGMRRPPLGAHPTLRQLALGPWTSWRTAARAAMHFALLAPVLTGVTQLTISAWPGASNQPLNPFWYQSSSRQVMCYLPDLSPCSSLVSLVFGDGGSSSQEEVCAMVAPLQQLQRIVLVGARQVDASVVVQLHDVLPHLQRVQLKGCGVHAMWGPGDQAWQGMRLVTE